MWCELTSLKLSPTEDIRLEIHDSLSREKKLNLTQASWAKSGETLVKFFNVKLKQDKTEEKLVEIYVQKCFSTIK